MSFLLLMDSPSLTDLVRAMFAANEQGIWLDPSDFSTLFQDAAGTTPVTALGQPVGLIRDKSGRGNHASQTTAASRPTVEARVNLLTYSEQMGNAAWQKTRTTVTSGAITGPLGALADKISEDTSTNTHYISQLVFVPSGVLYTASIYVKAAGRTRAMWYMTDNATGPSEANINLATGTVTLTGYGSWTGTSASIADVGDGWYRVTVSGVKGAGTVIDSILLFADNSGAYDYTGDGVSGMYATAAQFEYGPVSTYQKVNTATDYVDVGAPRYSALNKTDNHLLVAAGGAGTTGFLLVAGVVVPAAGTARTLWSDRGTNTGYKVGIDASNQIFLSAGNGAAFVTATGPALVAGTKYVITAWHDGANLNISVNNGAPTQAAFVTATAGTATFTIGKANASATEYWGDRIYGMVYRKNDRSAAGQRSSLYSYMVGKMGGL